MSYFLNFYSLFFHTVLSLLLLSCTHDPARTLSSTSTLTEDFLKKVMRESSREEPFYGNVLVAHGDDVIAEASLGKASEEFDLDNTKDSRFVLASVSKQFSAGAIHQLLERGRLSLNDKITRFIPLTSVHPQNQKAWEKITIADLLGHRAGLMKDPQPDFINTSKKYRLNHLVSEIIRDPRLTSQKYGQFYYSNIGYTLLARVVEIVTSFDYEMYVNFKLLRPLKAFQSGLYHRSKIIKSLATGYYRNEDNHYQRLCCVDFSTNMGSHNLYSSTHDLLKWTQDLMHHHKSVPPSFLEFEGASKIDANTTYMNGLYRTSHPKLGLHFTHDGFSGGYATRVSFFPERDLTVIILLNRVNVFTAQNQIEAIHQRIIDSL